MELAIVVPTFNEKENVRPLLDRLRRTLQGVSYEVIFVDDDSPDGTAALIREIARTDPTVRLLHRIGRRGLASACLEGMLSTTASLLAVMDADLQHDETILPEMLARIRTGKYDVAIGSRNLAGGGMGGFAPRRVALSNLGLAVSRLIAGQQLTDPMSGYFLMTRAFFEEVMRSTTGVGFKIMLDLIASSKRPIRFTEVPYEFRQREAGVSKLDLNIAIEYLYLVADKLIGQWLPIRFVLYCLVGAMGVAVHLSILWLLYVELRYRLENALLVAITVALLANYAVNNILTYRERRLRGWAFLTGLIVYALACSVGNLSNYALTKLLVDRGVWWPLAGISGLAVGSVWNFAASSIFTWGTAAKRVG